MSSQSSLSPYNIIQLLANCVSLSSEPQHKNLVLASLYCIIDLLLCTQLAQHETHDSRKPEERSPFTSCKHIYTVLVVNRLGLDRVMRNAWRKRAHPFCATIAVAIIWHISLTDLIFSWKESILSWLSLFRLSSACSKRHSSRCSSDIAKDIQSISRNWPKQKVSNLRLFII